MTLNNVIIVRSFILLLLLLLVGFMVSFAQQQTYFYKIQNLIFKERSDTIFYEKLDSLKKTRRPNDSEIRILFDRDVDFGYKHKRIHIALNGITYQINMLNKNDTICFSSVTLNNIFGEPNRYEISFNQRKSLPYINSLLTIAYLGLRNMFYKSSKTLVDLKKELDLNTWYGLSSGDGQVDSQEKKHIDTLVKRKDFHELEAMLKSINCETQTYAVRGFTLLQKKKISIPTKDKIIINYIRTRNSVLESSMGDLGPVAWRAFK